MKINLGVLFGGNSTEHEISVISAVQAMNHLDTEKYNIIPIYMSKESLMYTSKYLLDIENYKNLGKLMGNSEEVFLVKDKNDAVLIKNKFPYKHVCKLDIILPVMHGYNTEDGCIAGYLETLGVPYCESDIYASVIGQDKIYQKMVLKENGVRVTDYRYFYESEYLASPEKVLKRVMELDFPVIVKPSRQGSSVGISKANNKKELIVALEEALEYDEKILVEKVVENLCELNISVVGDNASYEVSVIEEVFGKDNFLSYEDKYLSGGKSAPSKGMASTGRKVPADIPKKVQKELEEMATKACMALNTNGVVRIDFLLDTKSGLLYLNEMNLIPGSLSFYLWTPMDVDYKTLLDKIIDTGIRRYQNKAKKLSSFETNVLESFKGTKGVKK